MFSSIFSTSAPVDPHAPNFHPVSERVSENELFGELEAKDTEWLCATSGFVAETQTFYITAEDGTSIMFQVIHSAVGVWYPTIQVSCKIANPTTGQKIWKSINVSNFAVAPSGHDKRSSKADEFTIYHKSNSGPEFPESYTLNANLGTDLQLSFDIKRPAAIPGFKVGKGPKGGYSYFGTDTEKADGFVIHRFWPRAEASGHIIHNGKAESVKGSGMFIHAIQGMRPNLVAASWNFADFQSDALGGVSLIQMDFTTPLAHGKKGAGSGGVCVNVGSLVVGGKLVAVSTETKYPGEEPKGLIVSRATHLEPEHDPDTSYGMPTKISYELKAPSIVADAPGSVEAKLTVDLGTVASPKGLIEKVDFLAEVPYVLKVAVNYVAGTKPFIYQWINPAKLHITGPEALAAGLSSGVEVEGKLYNEATFISALES